MILQTDGGARGARLHVHDRPRQRDLRRGDPRLRAAGRRPRRRRDLRRPRRVLALARRTTRSCAGSGPRRASSTSRWPPSSTRCGICTPSRRGKPLWKLLADMTPRQIVDGDRLPVHHRRADAGRGDRDPRAAARRRKARTRADPAARRLPRLHDVRRLDGLLRRQGAPPLPRGASPTASRTSR